MIENYRRLKREESRKAKLVTLADMMSTVVEPSDKIGYDWEITKLGEVVLCKEYIPNNNYTIDGGDYLNPIRYVEGMTVEVGKWYTDGDDIWEAIQNGIPRDFADKNFFDVIS